MVCAGPPAWQGLSSLWHTPCVQHTMALTVLASVCHATESASDSLGQCRATLA